MRTLAARHVIEDPTLLQQNEKLTLVSQMQQLYRRNHIRTTKYAALSFLPKNLFEQFHRFANIYFVFIILLNFVPQISAIQPFVSMIPVICILAVQAVKDLVEDYRRKLNDREVNGAHCEAYVR